MNPFQFWGILSEMVAMRILQNMGQLNYISNTLRTFKVPSRQGESISELLPNKASSGRHQRKMNNGGAIHLHRCLEGGLPQRPSWSSAPSSPRSDSGSESSAPGSRRGHRGRRQGSRPRRGKGRSDLRRGHHRGQRERETEREGGRGDDERNKGGKEKVQRSI